MCFFVDLKVRKPLINHDNQDNKGKKMEQNSSDTDSSDDAMDDTPSTHFDIFDVLSEAANSHSNDTVDAPVNQTASMNSEETETNPDAEVTSDEENAEPENSSPHEENSDNSSSKIAKSKYLFFLKGCIGYILQTSLSQFYKLISFFLKILIWVTFTNIDVNAYSSLLSQRTTHLISECG